MVCGIMINFYNGFWITEHFAFVISLGFIYLVSIRVIVYGQTIQKELQSGVEIKEKYTYKPVKKQTKKK